MNRVYLVFLTFFVFVLSIIHLVDRASAQEAGKIYYTPADKLAEYISSQPGKKAVFIYTSWCPHCRKAMPDIIDIEKAKDGSIIAISTDRNPGQFARYLLKMGEVPFPAFVARSRYEGEFMREMKKIGINFPGSIPYIALIDENNQIEEQGFLHTESVANFILEK